MYHLPVFEVLKGILKVLAWIGENLPDNPRLARWLILIGILSGGALFLPTDATDVGMFLSMIQVLCVTAGSICMVLGLFVFFRRTVWRRQEKLEPRVLSLDLVGYQSKVEKETSNPISLGGRGQPPGASAEEKEWASREWGRRLK